jgi:Family of unknown function (DUF5681)
MARHDENHLDSNNAPVGYGNPPKHTRFKPGQSGNPRGRPRKSKNISDLIKEELDAKIDIREGQKTQRVSRREALVKRMVSLALGGNIKVLDWIVKNCPDALNDPHTESFNEQDARERIRATFKNIVERYGSLDIGLKKELAEAGLDNNTLGDLFGHDEDLINARRRNALKKAEEYGISPTLIARLRAELGIYEEQTVESRVDHALNSGNLNPPT